MWAGQVTAAAVRAFAASGVLSVTSLSAPACPSQIPSGLSPLDVAQEVATNGMALWVTQVEGSEPVDALLDRTEKAWKQAGFGVKRNSAQGWSIVSALGERCLVTLQLKAGKRSSGFLAINRPITKSVASLAGFGVSLPADAKVTSNVASDDSGRRGVTVSMTTPKTLDDVSQFFIDQLGKQQWTAIRPHRVRSANAKPQTAQLISAQRGRQQIQIMAWTEMETQVVMTVADGL